MKILKGTQQKIVDGMSDHMRDVISGKSEINSIALTAVTGSGKTLMLSHLINNNRNVFYLFISPRKTLTQQSTEVLMRELGENVTVKTVTRDSIQETPLPGDVYICNWESLTKDSDKERRNLTRTDLEGRSFIEWVKAIASAGTPFALIVDECHHGRSLDRKDVSTTQALTEEIEETVNLCNTPFILIDSSATHIPLTTLKDGKSVEREYRQFSMKYAECAQEGLLKPNFYINSGLSAQGRSGLESLVKAAVKKQAHIAAAAAESSDCEPFNPLISIILSNDSGTKSKGVSAKGKGSAQRKWAERVLEDLGLDLETEVAVHVTGETKNMENISDPKSPVKVVFSKVALLEGWDCPRAYIIVDLRNSSSEIVKAQTFGRIMRSFNGKHYANEVLNTAYYYSEDVDADDVAQNIRALDEYFATFYGDSDNFVLNKNYADLSRLISGREIKQTQTKRRIVAESVEESAPNDLRVKITERIIGSINMGAEHTHNVDEKLIKIIRNMHQTTGAGVDVEVVQPLGSHAFNFANPESAAESLINGIMRELRRSDNFSGRTPSEVKSAARKLLRAIQDAVINKIHMGVSGSKPESSLKRKANMILAAEENMPFVLQAATEYATAYTAKIDYPQFDAGLYKIPPSARLPHSMVETKRKTLYGKLDEAGEFHYYTFKPASTPEEDFEAEVSKIKKVSVIQKLPQTGVMSLSIALSKTTFTPDYMVVVGTNRSAKPIFIEVKGVKSQDSKELIREKAEAMREFERLHGVKAALVQQDSDGKFRTYDDRETLEAFIG